MSLATDLLERLGEEVGGPGPEAVWPWERPDLPDEVEVPLLPDEPGHLGHEVYDSPEEAEADVLEHGWEGFTEIWETEDGEWHIYFYDTTNPDE